MDPLSTCMALAPLFSLWLVGLTLTQTFTLSFELLWSKIEFVNVESYLSVVELLKDLSIKLMFETLTGDFDIEESYFDSFKFCWS